MPERLATYWQKILSVGATPKPIKYGPGGHYRTSHQAAIIASQAAASRLFEIRNTATSNLIVITSLRIQWLPTGAHTAAIEDSLDLFKVTGFSAVDTTNTVTPTVVAMRTSMAAAPGGAAVRGVTVAGAAAGMTGGTMTISAQPLVQLPQWLLATLPTASVVAPAIIDWFQDNGEHPLVLANNEGIVVQNRVLLGVAAASSVYLDVAWAEVDEYLPA